MTNNTSLILLLGLLSGCAAISPENCDPDNEGFINTTVGVLSGCFEKRSQINADRNEQAKARTVALKNENDVLKETNANQKERLGAIQRRKANIESEIIKLTNIAEEQEEVAELEAQIAKLKIELKTLEKLERSMLE